MFCDYENEARATAATCLRPTRGHAYDDGVNVISRANEVESKNP